MLTADLAFTVDEEYAKLVNEYSTDIQSLEKDFAASWYRLTSQDMGPRSRCIGSMIPDAQPWQSPQPDAPATKPDYVPIRARIQAKLDSGDIKGVDAIRLAFQCADTFRNSDWRGGCNGARIRFPPQSEWSINAGLDAVIDQLETIDRGDASIADMIVLAGNAALEKMGGKSMAFCGGRVDAADAAFTNDLAPRDFIISNVGQVNDDIELKGLSLQQGVAMYGRPTDRYPEIGSLFVSLLSNTFVGPNADGHYTVDGARPVTALEYALFENRELRTIMEQLKDNNDALHTLIAEGWTILMTNDRFSGNTGNACDGVADRTLEDDTPAPTPAETEAPTKSGSSVMGIGVSAVAAVVVMML